MNDGFRPSSMLRRQKCPGSLALESSLPSAAEYQDEYQAQGTRLHALLADPSLPRDGCTPSELELIETVEKAEAEFFATVLRQQPRKE